MFMTWSLNPGGPAPTQTPAGSRNQGIQAPSTTLPRNKRKTATDAFQNAETSQAPNQPTQASSSKRRKPNPSQNPNPNAAISTTEMSEVDEAHRHFFKERLGILKAVNRSEIAEYNFGRPDNLYENPFKAHWEALDRQHQQLATAISNYTQAHPGATTHDFLKAYTDHYHALAQAGQAGTLEIPHSVQNRMIWLQNMLNKANSPREPLSSVWNRLLEPWQQTLLIKASNFTATNPGTTHNDFIKAYTQEYDALVKAGKAQGMFHPTSMAKELTFLHEMLQKAHA